MKTYTDAELAAIASKRLSQLLGYDIGEPFQNPSASYWTLGPSNNLWFRRDEWGDVQVWCRYPGLWWACAFARLDLLRLLHDDPCECGAPWCAACAEEAKAVRQRSLEAEADFIAGSLDTEAPPV